MSIYVSLCLSRKKKAHLHTYQVIIIIIKYEWKKKETILSREFFYLASILPFVDAITHIRTYVCQISEFLECGLAKTK